MKKNLLISIFAFIGAAAMHTAQAQIIIDQGTCGSSLAWILTDDYTLTISGSGAMESPFGWDPYREIIKTVIISDGVTIIGGFYNCSLLDSVSIGNSVTIIGGIAFLSCFNLTSINIPNSVKSISPNSFYGCEQITTLIIGNSVTSIGYMAFYKCNIKTLICKASTPPVIDNSAESFWYARNAQVTVPCNTLSAYQESFWGDIFSNIVEDCNNLDEMVHNEKIDVYPNPNTGELIVTSYELQVTSIEIFDVNGRKQKAENRRQKAEGEIVIDTSHLPAGIYFVKIITNQGEVVKKIIKQ